MLYGQHFQAPLALAAMKFPKTIDLVVRAGATGKGMHGVIAHLPILESRGSGKKLTILREKFKKKKGNKICSFHLTS